MLTHILKQSCDILGVTLDKYGAKTLASTTTIPCRFREITQFDRLGNRDDINAIAMLWVAGDADVSEQTVVKVNDRVYVVSEIVLARKMSGNTVQFRKCLLEKYVDITDGSDS
jgi:hypothetical protein